LTLKKLQFPAEKFSVPMPVFQSANIYNLIKIRPKHTLLI